MESYRSELCCLVCRLSEWFYWVSSRSARGPSYQRQMEEGMATNLTFPSRWSLMRKRETRE